MPANSVSIARRCLWEQRGPGPLSIWRRGPIRSFAKRKQVLNKKVVLGVLAAAIAVAYGGSTWWAGTKIKSRYDIAFDELPKQTALVRVTERKYERGFFGAVSTVTLEIGCAADAAAPAAAAPAAADKPAEGEEAEADEEEDAGGIKPPKQLRLTIRDTIHHGPLAGGTLAAATIDSELVLDERFARIVSVDEALAEASLRRAA